MAIHTRLWNWRKVGIRVGALALAAMLVGCGQQKPAEDSATSADGASAQENVPSVPLDPRLHQAFVEATTSEPPEDWHRPPDTTLSGKSVGKLYMEVKNSWDQIRFASPAGKPLAYWATLETEMGDIEITLRPDLAPNHVRNFIALAQAGYFDGLVFERTVHEDGPDGKLELIEGGCPVGTGEMGYGSIGYWMKPEIHPEIPNEEGTLGASHGMSKDTAACKFYITLSRCPFMDGEYTVFGKVTQGLGIVRKILSLPVRDDNEYPDGDRPIKPIVINKVTIHSKEVESLTPTGETQPSTSAAAEH
jgi:peptidyl-prolyl cis-trans isomerase B (cyclophilin B)